MKKVISLSIMLAFVLMMKAQEKVYQHLGVIGQPSCAVMVRQCQVRDIYPLGTVFCACLVAERYVCRMV